MGFLATFLNINVYILLIISRYYSKKYQFLLSNNIDIEFYASQ